MANKRLTESEIEQKVIDNVAEEFGVDRGTITRNSKFIDDLHADSLDTTNLIMKLEDEFKDYKLTIPDEEAEKMETVGQVVDYIAENYSKNQKPYSPAS